MATQVMPAHFRRTCTFRASLFLEVGAANPRRIWLHQILCNSPGPSGSNTQLTRSHKIAVQVERTAYTLILGENVSNPRTERSPLAAKRAAHIFILLCFGSMTLPTASLAQTKGTGSPADPPRTLGSKEAQAILMAAREHRLGAERKPDCSHLVHEVYQSAGFEYPFANSHELYAGAERFVRVKAAEAQRGDLIVWPGHVGIVVDPALRAFYSSLRSGLRLDFYDTDYWRKRGKARFYRYAIRGPLRTELASVRTVAPEPGMGEATVPVAATASNEAMTSEPSSVTSASSVSSKSATRSALGDEIPLEWPDRTMFRAARRTPTEDEIAAAIAELQTAAASSFQGRDLLKMDRPVVVVDQVELEGFAIKGERGWAVVRADLRMSVTGEKVELKPSRENRRWELRRAGDAWILSAPKGRAYVSRDAAVSILGAQLATLAQNPQTTTDSKKIEKQKLTTVRMLNAIVAEK